MCNFIRLMCFNRSKIKGSKIVDIELFVRNGYIEKPCCQMAVDAGRSSATETGSYTHSSP